jgi:dihydropteroate synthase
MISQVINLSPGNIFRYYCDKYAISKGKYSYGLFGLELRGLDIREAEYVFTKISEKGEKVYQFQNSDDMISLFLVGSIRKFKIIAGRISDNTSGRLSLKLFNTINFFESYDLTNYRIGDKLFEFNKAYIMGILNVTPDSFSDGGKYYDRNKALAYAFKMLDEGADIIDIGGESSRPGAERIDTKIETERIIPVIKKILDDRPDTIISVDTTKRDVAEKALEYGAKIINDISGGKFEPDIIETVAKHNAAIIIMHLKGTPQTMQDAPIYGNVVEEVYDYLYIQVKKAEEAGINNIFIDPGIGFGKTTADNLNLLNRLDDFKSLAHPITIGVSRKSFIGKSLNLEVDERDIPTSMMEALSVNKGARIIRTHNIINGVMLRELFNKTNNITAE